MCGRITQQLPSDQICELYHLRGTPLPPDRQPRYNGAPGQDFTACRVDEDGDRAIALLRWGLVPSWVRDTRAGPRLINARAETVHNKPSFRDAFRSRRCWPPNPDRERHAKKVALGGRLRRFQKSTGPPAPPDRELVGHLINK